MKTFPVDFWKFNWYNKEVDNTEDREPRREGEPKWTIIPKSKKEQLVEKILSLSGEEFSLLTDLAFSKLNSRENQEHQPDHRS